MEKDRSAPRLKRDLKKILAIQKIITGARPRLKFGQTIQCYCIVIYMLYAHVHELLDVEVVTGTAGKRLFLSHRSTKTRSWNKYLTGDTLLQSQKK